MEEKKKLAAIPKEQPTDQPKKYTYEEIAKIASELSMENQKLVSRIRQMQEALEQQDFNYSSFLLTMLFKVVEHPEMYKPDFIEWAVQHIEDALRSFVGAPEEAQKQETNEAE